jgi:hypothetical protein
LPPQPPNCVRSAPPPVSLPRFCSGGPLGPCFRHAFLYPRFFSTIPIRIRTYAKHAHKPRRIRTSKTQHLKSFRIRIYEKTGRGVPPLVTSLTPRPYSLRGTAASHSTQLSPWDRDNGPITNSLVHCLSHGGFHHEHIRQPQPSRRTHCAVPSFPSPSPITK